MNFGVVFNVTDEGIQVKPINNEELIIITADVLELKRISEQLESDDEPILIIYNDNLELIIDDQQGI